MKQPTLHTQRLTLRLFMLEDAPDVQRLAGDYGVASTALLIPHPYTDGLAEEWIGTHQPGFETGELAVFAAVHRAEGYLVGAASLGIEREHDRAELGYWIGRPYWNRGYATEAVRAIIPYGFRVLGLNRIRGSHFPRNPASGRVMQKAGMRYEGCLRQHVKKWGRYEDLMVYGVLREDAVLSAGMTIQPPAEPSYAPRIPIAYRVAGRGSCMQRIIDWNELWKAIHVSSPERLEKERDPAARWDRRAAAYQRATRDEKKATEQELGVLDIRPGETVLDMGAGTGRLAVPIAGIAAHVTALDPSGGMLSILRERMAENGRENYSCVRMRWEDVEIGRDIERHDVAVAAFSLGFYDLGAALQKLDAAARRAVYLYWHAGEWRSPEEMALYRTVFGEEGARQKGYPDYIYAVNILHDAGIYANVRIYHAIWDTAFDSIDEAARNWAEMHSPDREDLGPIVEYFSRALQKDASGKYVQRAVRSTAAIWWTKEGG